MLQVAWKWQAVGGVGKHGVRGAYGKVILAITMLVSHTHVTDTIISKRVDRTEYDHDCVKFAICEQE